MVIRFAQGLVIDTPNLMTFNDTCNVVTNKGKSVTSLWFSQYKSWELALSGDCISHSASSCFVTVLVVSVSVCDRLTNWLVSSLLIA